MLEGLIAISATGAEMGMPYLPQCPGGGGVDGMVR